MVALCSAHPRLWILDISKCSRAPDPSFVNDNPGQIQDHDFNLAEHAGQLFITPPFAVICMPHRFWPSHRGTGSVAVGALGFSIYASTNSDVRSGSTLAARRMSTQCCASPTAHHSNIQTLTAARSHKDQLIFIFLDSNPQKYTWNLLQINYLVINFASIAFFLLKPITIFQFLTIHWQILIVKTK